MISLNTWTVIYNYKIITMKPEVNKKEIRRAKFKYPWYKSFIKILRNRKQKDYRKDQTIHLS